MPEVEIDKKTRWECQRCGDCCKGIIISVNKDISIVKDGGIVCKFLNSSNNHCANYDKRPFICRLYPFVIGLDNIVKEGVARPQDAFSLENMKIHSECRGFGKGKRIFANKNLQKKLEGIAHDFAVRLKECFEKKRDISEVI